MDCPTQQLSLHFVPKKARATTLRVVQRPIVSWHMGPLSGIGMVFAPRREVWPGTLEPGPYTGTKSRESLQDRLISTRLAARVPTQFEARRSVPEGWSRQNPETLPEFCVRA